MSPIIQVEELSKKFIISHEGSERYTALRDVMADKAKAIVKQKIEPASKEDFWALKDVSFAVNQGDRIGVIGRNGAGKSTLLKILSRITEPTKGRIAIRGRVASLLEVGTGFHPELTGRENVYLNGAILGMSRMEIRSKFDEIVDFAEVERFLDTPVKRYSSGMYVRLAFAVAAHLEPEILIVDEVLAVGDAQFQRKCLGKMQEVSKEEGRTVLFVSHNVAAIQNLCNEVIVMENGGLSFMGATKTGIKKYLSSRTRTVLYESELNAKKIAFSKIAVKNQDNIIKEQFGFDDKVEVEIAVKVAHGQSIKGMKVGFFVMDELERKIFTTENDIESLKMSGDQISGTISIPAKLLLPGVYFLNFAIHIPNVEIHDMVKDSISFEIVETGSAFYQYQGVDNGCVFVDCKWS